MPTRRTLPNRRHSWRQKYRVGTTTFYLTCGEYEDNTLGEIFVDVAKAGSAIRATLDSFAKNFSIALQYGSPLKVLVEAHIGLDFEPSGPVIAGGSAVHECRSIVDCIMLELKNVYLETP
jgi:ribonucleoside-diphosphate reductase alpha chain